MAFQLPSPGEAEGAVWPHEWLAYDNYLTVHHRYMVLLENEGILLENHLIFTEVTDNTNDLVLVQLQGHLYCSGDVSIRVDKTLEVKKTANGSVMVKGKDYSYHAWIGQTGQEILRYDMAHYWEALHCHVFDLHTGQEEVYPITLEQLPTLDGFIRIACKRSKGARDMPPQRQ
jgi:hypothetical protein